MSEGLLYRDCFNGHLMELMEIRKDGNNLYRDTVDGSRVICKLKDLLYPARTAPFAPVGMSHGAA